MAPPPVVRMMRAAARATMKVPTTLTSSTLRMRAAGVSRAALSAAMPAELTTPSMRLSASPAMAIAFSVAGSLVTSSAWVNRRRGLAMRSASSVNALPSRSMAATFQPAWSSRATVAHPMPDPAPVTSATLSPPSLALATRLTHHLLCAPASGAGPSFSFHLARRQEDAPHQSRHTLAPGKLQPVCVPNAIANSRAPLRGQPLPPLAARCLACPARHCLELFLAVATAIGVGQGAGVARTMGNRRRAAPLMPQGGCHWRSRSCRGLPANGPDPAAGLAAAHRLPARDRAAASFRLPGLPSPENMPPSEAALRRVSC